MRILVLLIFGSYNGIGKEAETKEPWNSFDGQNQREPEAPPTVDDRRLSCHDRPAQATLDFDLNKSITYSVF